MAPTVVKGIVTLMASVLGSKRTPSKAQMEEHDAMKYSELLRWQEWKDGNFPVVVHPLTYKEQVVLCFPVHAGDIDVDGKFDESVLMESVRLWGKGEVPVVIWTPRKDSPQDLFFSFGRTGILLLFKKLDDDTAYWTIMHE